MAARQRHRSLGIWQLVLLALLLPLVAVAWSRSAQAQIGSARYSSIVVDTATGRVLESDQPNALRHPASLAKLMTLYFTFQALRDNRITLSTLVPVSAHCASMEPTKLGLRPGWRLTVDQAILGIVTESANDAACALGELLGGTEPHYAQMATLRARALGMSRTTFANASGLPAPGEWTTAHDMSVLARDLITSFPQYYHYFSTNSLVYHGMTFFNHDTMLKSYPGADGMKTGFTDASGHNLVTSAVRGGVRLVGVVLGAGSNWERNRDMTLALNGGYADLNVGGRGARMAGRFRLISTAEAVTIEHPRPVTARWSPARSRVERRVAERRTLVRPAAEHVRAAPASGWTIQVGSFTSPRAARMAASRARLHTHYGAAHIERLRWRHRIWFRAQLTGFTEASARRACAVVARYQRGGCVVLRPAHPVVASR